MLECQSQAGMWQCLRQLAYVILWGIMQSLDLIYSYVLHFSVTLVLLMEHYKQ